MIFESTQVPDSIMQIPRFLEELLNLRLPFSHLPIWLWVYCFLVLLLCQQIMGQVLTGIVAVMALDYYVGKKNALTVRQLELDAEALFPDDPSRLHWLREKVIELELKEEEEYW